MASLRRSLLRTLPAPLLVGIALVVGAIVGGDVEQAPVARWARCEPLPFPVVPPKVPGPAPPPVMGRATVRAGDLRLQVAENEVGVRVGEREVGRGTDLVSVREAGDRPSLLDNGGFESVGDDGVPEGFRFTGAERRPSVDDRVVHGGARSIRVENPERRTSGAFQVELPVDPHTFYTASVWTKSSDVQPSSAPAAVGPLRLQVDQLSSDGVVATSWAFGYTGTSDWAEQFVGFRTRDCTQRVRIRGFLRSATGTAWFDDLALAPLFEEEVLAAVGGRITQTGPGAARLIATDDAGVEIDTAFQARGNRIDVRGDARSTDDREKAVQVSFTLPVDATGWSWGDDPRHARAIEEGGLYEALSVPARQEPRFAYGGLNQVQQTSRFPFGVVYDDRTAVAIGVPLSEPRMFRIAYGPGGLTITFDLGLSPRTAALGGARADFAFTIYAPDQPEWGFRAAANGYYDAFPDAFEHRTPPRYEGAWFVAPPLESIEESYRDFGLGLNMVALGKASTQSFSTWGRPYVNFGDANHITTTAYTHQWAFFQPIDPEEPAPTYDEAVGMLQALAASEPADPDEERLRDEARAALLSAERDHNGRLYYEVYRAFGRAYLAWYQNHDALPDQSTEWSRAVLEHQMRRALAEARAAIGRLDAIHLDSTSGQRRWGAIDDHDPRHWAATTVPLTFSYNTGRPVERGILAMHQQIERAAEWVRARSMLLTANFNSGTTRTAGWLGADLIDWFGFEQGIRERGRFEFGGVDGLAMLKRTIAYQRPVTTLDTKLADGSLDLEQIAGRIEENLFYGIYPGAWVRAENEDHQTEPTWSTEEKRAVFARYTPLFRVLAEAGWEPVTDARVDDPGVWVERYGAAADGDLIIALRNHTRADRRVTVSIDLGAQPLGDDVVVEELLTGAEVDAAGPGANLVATISVPGGSTRLLSFTDPEAR